MLSFSTVQKFRPVTGGVFPEITDRSNVIVMVDEAHRTQYGFDAKMTKQGDVKHGLAYQLRQALPNAVYVAFTGTPIELPRSTVKRDISMLRASCLDLQHVA